ncbi:unnamed protein product [Absidia cylindrospora]
MYFSLPTSQERSQQQSSHVEKAGPVDTLKGSTITSCAPFTTTTTTTSCSSTSSNMNYLTDEQLLEIVENLEDHWQSPPILTPTTLAMIFNNGYSDTSPSRSNSICEKNAISTASLQCFISQLQKTVAIHIPSLEKVIKEDTILGDIRDGSTSIPPLGALDHLTQLLATFNQSASSTTVTSINDKN